MARKPPGDEHNGGSEAGSSAKKKSLRRQIIFRRVVLDNQPLPLRELWDLCADPTYDRTKLETDIDNFGKVGCYITIRQRGKAPSDEDELVFLEGPHTDDDTVREQLNESGKGLVAQLVARLICGFPKVEHEHIELLPEWMDQLHIANHQSAIENLWRERSDQDITAAKVAAVLAHLGERSGINDPKYVPAQAKALTQLFDSKRKSLETSVAKLRSRLEGFWAEANRMVAIDSGTTNIVLARDYLANLRIPMAGSPLCALTVCTNSRRIFEVLGNSRIPVKTIIIGGQQKFRSPTICGAMAELFLKSVSLLQFGMCILGSTRLDLERFAICSDSQEESSIKTLLMERSSMRIVAVDNSKLQAGLGRTGYKFASIDPNHVDLIVTNSPIRQKDDDEGALSSFYHFVEAIETRGVPVLVATAQATYPYPRPQP